MEHGAKISVFDDGWDVPRARATRRAYAAVSADTGRPDTTTTAVRDGRAGGRGDRRTRGRHHRGRFPRPPLRLSAPTKLLRACAWRPVDLGFGPSPHRVPVAAGRSPRQSTDRPLLDESAPVLVASFGTAWPIAKAAVRPHTPTPGVQLPRAGGLAGSHYGGPRPPWSAPRSPHPRASACQQARSARSASVTVTAPGRAAQRRDQLRLRCGPRTTFLSLLQIHRLYPFHSSMEALTLVLRGLVVAESRPSFPGRPLRQVGTAILLRA